MPNRSIEHCPLCNHCGEVFYQDLFFCCKECSGIFKAKKFLPTPEEEKMRYEQHNNDVTDARYKNFVSPIISAVKNDFSNDSLGLEFGAGTGPVVSKILGNDGYTIKQFDPLSTMTPAYLNFSMII